MPLYKARFVVFWWWVATHATVAIFILGFNQPFMIIKATNYIGFHKSMHFSPTFHMILEGYCTPPILKPMRMVRKMF